MKFIQVFILTNCLLISLAASREFKSADGGKTLEAEFVSYNPHTKQVTLESVNGRRLTTAADLFCEEDQQYFIKSQLAKDLKGAVTVRFKSLAAQKSEIKDGNILYFFRDYENSFVLENTSRWPLKDLKARYWVVVEDHDEEQDEVIVIHDGSADIEEIEADGEFELKGPTVTLSSSAAADCKPHAKEHEVAKVMAIAATIKRDRVLGAMIEVLDADGVVLASDCSSKRIELIMEDHLKK